jgi:hypothetical protein
MVPVFVTYNGRLLGSRKKTTQQAAARCFRPIYHVSSGRSLLLETLLRVKREAVSEALLLQKETEAHMYVPHSGGGCYGEEHIIQDPEYLRITHAAKVAHKVPPPNFSGSTTLPVAIILSHHTRRKISRR